MPSLLSCPRCGRHTRSEGAHCDHCAAPLTPGPGAAAGATALLLALGLGGCDDGFTAQPPYGLPDTATAPDQDGDGYTTADDCDDDDATVNPGATETPRDGVDSNCDGGDDT